MTIQQISIFTLSIFFTGISAKLSDKEQHQVNKLLYAAALENDPKSLQALIDQGAELNYVDPGSQFTVLGIATKMGWNNIVKLLLEAGADPNFIFMTDQSLNGNTAIRVAAIHHNRDLIRLLLQFGANPSVAIQELLKHGAPGSKIEQSALLLQKEWQNFQDEQKAENQSQCIIN